jgi:hypothetical protein
MNPKISLKPWLKMQPKISLIQEKKADMSPCLLLCRRLFSLGRDES